MSGRRGVRSLARRALTLVACAGTCGWAACWTDVPELPPEPPPRLRPRAAPEPARPPHAPPPSGLVTSAEPDPELPRGPRDPEPNDDRASAVPLAPGQRAIGYLDPPRDPEAPLVGDQDWYVVDIPGEGAAESGKEGGFAVVRAELTGAEDLDIVLEWMGRDGAKDVVLARADLNERRPGPEVLPALGVPPGRAYFRVREAWYKGRPRTGSALPYALRVMVAPWEPGVEVEPNDSASTAGRVPWGRPAQGTFGHVRDLDMWRFDLPAVAAGRPVVVTLSGVDGVTPEVGLSWGDAGPTVVHGRGEAGAGVRLRAVSVPDGVPALLVAVQARSGAQPSRPYTLQVQFEPPAQGALEREPNDSPLLATRVDLGASPGPGGTAELVGFIDAKDDVDHFRLTLAQAATLHATLAPPVEADLELLVLTPNAEGPRARADDGRAGGGELIRGLGLEAGEWDVVVRGRRGSHDPHRPYALSLSLGDPRHQESEPNDDRFDPGVRRLQRGSRHEGWLFPAGDRDCWKVDTGATGEDRVPVTLAIQAPPDLPIALHVYDPDGVLVGSPQSLVGAAEAIFTYALGAGTYTVRVSATEPDRADPRGPYHIQVLD